ncbi:hypothetical protein WMY93_029059 [Mugilogobius chulae]|uniref:Uncharacterized protein n=1 Tax=Mugilogobius chulae TaxID=88201 RepID=A0AAW0MS02_9GOBI
MGHERPTLDSSWSLGLRGALLSLTEMVLRSHPSTPHNISTAKHIRRKLGELFVARSSGGCWASSLFRYGHLSVDIVNTGIAPSSLTASLWKQYGGVMCVGKGAMKKQQAKIRRTHGTGSIWGSVVLRGNR